MACVASAGTIVADSLETIYLHTLTFAPNVAEVTDAIVTYTITNPDDPSTDVMSATLTWDGSVTTDPETGAPINGAYISYTEDTTQLTPGVVYRIRYTANGSIVPTENGESYRTIEAV